MSEIIGQGQGQASGQVGSNFDIDSVVADTTGTINEQGQALESLMQGGNLDNPADMLKMQFAMQKYTMTITAQSEFSKGLKDTCEKVTSNTVR